MITPKQMVNVTNYFYAAQAISPVEGMAGVWADFVNDQLPDLVWTDLLPAARACLVRWANDGRSWKVDLPRFANECRMLQNERWERFRSRYPDLNPHPDMTPAQGIIWRKTLIRVVSAGVTDPCEAARLAYAETDKIVTRINSETLSAPNPSIYPTRPLTTPQEPKL